MTIRIVRNKINMCFMTKFVEHLRNVAIRNPRLEMRNYEPTLDYLNAVSKILLDTTAKYHTDRVTMPQLTLMQGQQHAECANVGIEQLAYQAMHSLEILRKHHSGSIILH